jgi:hypothetical protein
LRIRPAPLLFATLVLCSAGSARAEDGAVDGGAFDAGGTDVAALEIIPPPLPPPPSAPLPIATPEARRPEPVRTPGPIDVQAKPSFQHEGSLAATSPSLGLPLGWFVSVYGAAELNFAFDSSQSSNRDVTAPNNLTLATPGSFRGSTDSDYAGTRRSRFGLSLAGPVTGRVRARFVFETGLFARAEDRPRAQQLYLGIETPIVDVLVGRSYGLFGWGGKGFAPTTAAYNGVFGQIFDRPSQVRLSHIFRSYLFDFEVAAAAVAAPAGVVGPQGEMGLRLAFNRWRGAAAQGVGPAEVAPVQVALSALGRRLEGAYASDDPANRLPSLRAGGVALDLLVPIIPARGLSLRNALTLTLEVSRGSGIADLYPGLTGGYIAPIVRVDPSQPPVGGEPVWVSTFPLGTAGLDGNATQHTIDWRALVIGLHYHLPIGGGDRIWISAVHSRLRSDNILDMTPRTLWGAIWTNGHYYDATLFGRIWRGLHASIAQQYTKQWSSVRREASNIRTLVSLYYLF